MEIHGSHLGDLQDAIEQWSKPYMSYAERAAQTATQQSAKNLSRVGGSAGKQAKVLRP